MKNLIAALALLFCTTSLFGQSGDFRLGLLVSPSFSAMDTDDSRINGNGTNLGLKLTLVHAEKYLGYQNKAALFVGVGLGFNAGGTLQYDFGGDYLKKADADEEYKGELPPGVNIKYSIQYFDIPFGLKFLPVEFGRDFHLYFSPQLNLGIRSKAIGDIEKTGAAMLNVEDIIIKKSVNVFNLSWGLGAGIEYEVGNKERNSAHLQLGLLYQRGFTDVTDNDSVKTRDANNVAINDPEDSKGIISSVNVQIGIVFPL